MAYEFYTTLGVDRSASPEDIKKAYRKKAMELHPDRHQWDKSKEAEFKKVNEAYSILSDPDKKSGYDRFGTADAGAGFGGSGGFNGGGFGAEFNMGDIFETFFGGSAGFGGGASGGGRRREVGSDLEVTVSLTFEEAYAGIQKEISFTKQVICSDCKGTGAKTPHDMANCPDCNGVGRVRRRVQTLFGVAEQTVTCDRCDGTGKVIKTPCPSCKWNRYVEQKRKRTIDIPAGIDDEMTIKLRDEGHEGRDGSGDLYVHFRVPSSFQGLTRDGNTLFFRAEFDPVEFVLGTRKSIGLPILGDREIDLKPGTDSGSELIFKHEWFADVSKKSAQRGNLVIQLILTMPKKLTKKERELYEAIAREKKLDTYDSKGFFEKLFG